MKKIISISLFFFVSIVLSQENKISKSDLVGYWAIDRFHPGADNETKIYKRCTFNQKGTVIQFKSNGLFNLKENRGTIKRCGNENRRWRPKNISGTFSWDSNLKKVKLKSNTDGLPTSWNLIWVGRNSFAVKKT
ncbi:hypothetical protein D1013_02745 [Euzebyella marina]|uniref:Lipocalin-like domain-containing protein n=1 Tax=Euzebyella marina TaxID=1761453 RepID=A0A3G2L2A3_9FLAO|nr:hypothetical protein [Euzebyella marina]AYN66375.1 hypothetical protein D1013_02745 [Euzebyella marina]